MIFALFFIRMTVNNRVSTIRMFVLNGVSPFGTFYTIFRFLFVFIPFRCFTSNWISTPLRVCVRRTAPIIHYSHKGNLYLGWILFNSISRVFTVSARGERERETERPRFPLPMFFSHSLHRWTKLHFSGRCIENISFSLVFSPSTCGIIFCFLPNGGDKYFMNCSAGELCRRGKGRRHDRRSNKTNDWIAWTLPNGRNPSMVRHIDGKKPQLTNYQCPKLTRILRCCTLSHLKCLANVLHSLHKHFY